MRRRIRKVRMEVKGKVVNTGPRFHNPMLMGSARSGAKPLPGKIYLFFELYITRTFQLGKYEVTQGQWQAVMGGNPSQFKDCGTECPVENVSWDDVQQFTARLDARDDGWRYRLPTEAEWEYAARAGTTGDFAGNLDAMGWYSNNAGGKTHKVGQKQANVWGLHDMHGNVWEWCLDWYGGYSLGAAVDPLGPTSGPGHIHRGGGWRVGGRYCRSAYRDGYNPAYQRGSLGFRLARFINSSNPSGSQRQSTC